MPATDDAKALVLANWYCVPGICAEFVPGIVSPEFIDPNCLSQVVEMGDRCVPKCRVPEATLQSVSFGDGLAHPLDLRSNPERRADRPLAHHSHRTASLGPLLRGQLFDPLQDRWLMLVNVEGLRNGYPCLVLAVECPEMARRWAVEVEPSYSSPIVVV